MTAPKICTILIKNEVNAFIGGLEKADIAILNEAFTFFVDGYFFMPAYQLGRWDGKITFFDLRGNTYTKILDEVVGYIVELGYEVDIDDKRATPRPILDRAVEDMFEAWSPGFRLRPYQIDCVNTLIDQGGGIVVAGTGAGKTSICAALCRILNDAGYKTCLIVPSTDLIEQTAETFIPLGVDTGEYSGSTKDVEHDTVISTWQALQNNMALMKLFDAVIVDEAHGTKGTVIRELINEHGSHLTFRCGVTGTIPKPIIDQYNLKISLGQVIKEISTKWLIDNGYLSTCDIFPIEMDDKARLRKDGVLDEFPDYSAEKAWVGKFAERVDEIAKFIKDTAASGNTFVLVNNIPFGKMLEKRIVGSQFLYGETERDTRQTSYKEFENRDDLICIASQGIASTGISIDRIFNLIFIDYGKSYIKAIQSCGRGLRKGGDKNHINIYDVFSNLKYGRKHFRERSTHYKEAQYPICDKIKLRY